MKTYKITNEHNFSKRHLQYTYYVVKDAGGKVFLAPIKQDGTVTAMGALARLCTWARKSDIREL